MRRVDMNASGIKDMTAYKAIMNAEAYIKPKDIWTVSNENQGEVQVLVLAVDSQKQYATVLNLRETHTGGHEVEITSLRGKRWTDCGIISYKYFNKFNEYEKTVNQQEYESVMEQIRGLFQIETCDADKTADMKMMIEDLKYRMKALKQENERLQELLKEAVNNGKASEIEKGVYEKLCMKLIGKEKEA